MINGRPFNLTHVHLWCDEALFDAYERMTDGGWNRAEHLMAYVQRSMCIQSVEFEQGLTAYRLRQAAKGQGLL